MSMGIVGGLITAGTTIYGAVSDSGDGGGGGGGGLSLDEARAQAHKEFSQRMDAWEKYWDERMPRMKKAAKESYLATKALIAKYKPMFAKHYKEQKQEKAFRLFVRDVNKLTDKRYGSLREQLARLSKGEQDPIFRQRVTEAEHELNREHMISLDQMLAANRRNINRGGIPSINPERQDEALAHSMALSRDKARFIARKDVEDTLTKLLGADIEMVKGELGAKHQLMDEYKYLGEAERKRLHDALTTAFGFDFSKIQNKAAFANAIDKLLAEKFSGRPYEGEYMRAWMTGAGQPGPSTGQTVRDVGQGVESLLTGLGSLWNTFNPSIPSLPTDPGGQVGPW